MKVDKNQSVQLMDGHKQYDANSGIPLRLEIAARIFPTYLEISGYTDAAGAALLAADALIKAHNESCEEGT